VFVNTVRRSQSDSIMIRAVARGDPLIPHILPSPKTPPIVESTLEHAVATPSGSPVDETAVDSLKQVLGGPENGVHSPPAQPLDPLFSMHVVPGVLTASALHAMHGLTTAHLNRLQENRTLYTIPRATEQRRDSFLHSASCDTSAPCDSQPPARPLAEAGRSMSNLQLTAAATSCDNKPRGSSSRKTHKRSVSDVTDYKAPATLVESPLHVKHPPSEPFLQRPHQEQTLISFLEAQDFSTCAELDRVSGFEVVL
jgi:hypothetical protein